LLQYQFEMRAVSAIWGFFRSVDPGGTIEHFDPARRHGMDPVVPEHQPDPLRVTQKVDHSTCAHNRHPYVQPKSEQNPLPQFSCPGQPETLSQEFLRQGRGYTSEIDGHWEECRVHGSCSVNGTLKFFSIDNGTLTTADGKAFNVKAGSKPNSIALGDAMIEMISDVLLQLRTNAGGLAYFHRADLLPQDVLRKLQGCWIHRDRHLGQRQTITIDGSMWTLGGGRSSQGILRMGDGAVVLGDLKIEIRSLGKMRVTSPSGRVHKFTLQRSQTSVSTIAE